MLMNGAVPQINSILTEVCKRRQFLLGYSPFFTGLGEQVTIFSKKTAGNRCSCYSIERGEAIFRCSQCYGTGFSGGYDIVQLNEYKKNLNIRINESTRVLNLEELGQVVDNKPHFWMSIYPMVYTGDIVVRKSNIRYVISNVKKTIHGGILTGLEGDLQELEVGHIIYDINFKWSI